MYSHTISGGEIHNLNLIRGALAAGYKLHFLCGHAFKGELEGRQIPATFSVTDDGVLPPFDATSFMGQLRLVVDYHRRLRGSLKVLGDIQPDDIVYCSTDFWWDFLPARKCSARRRILYIGMDAPSLKEVLMKTRPDVKAIRLPSLHYWLAQQASIRAFRPLANKKLIFAHENQAPRLQRMGYAANDLVYVGNGVDLHAPAAVPPQPKVYDAAWVGRVHKQKGIEDLVATLSHLNRRVPGFRAIMIGNLEKTLGPSIAAAGLTERVAFSGYVSEQEKFRLLKSSRVFLMPSKYESWGIVVGEALAGNLPVVAYDLACYRPVFGDLVRYVPCFDLAAFQQAAEEEVVKARAGLNTPDPVKLSRFIHENSWEKVAERFLGAIRALGD